MFYNAGPRRVNDAVGDAAHPQEDDLHGAGQQEEDLRKAGEDRIGPGVNVLITIFGDSDKFPAKKLTISLILMLSFIFCTYRFKKTQNILGQLFNALRCYYLFCFLDNFFNDIN
jgi:hypothetical protein